MRAIARGGARPRRSRAISDRSCAPGRARARLRRNRNRRPRAGCVAPMRPPAARGCRAPARLRDRARVPRDSASVAASSCLPRNAASPRARCLSRACVERGLRIGQADVARIVFAHAGDDRAGCLELAARQMRLRLLQQFRQRVLAAFQRGVVGTAAATGLRLYSGSAEPSDRHRDGPPARAAAASREQRIDARRIDFMLAQAFFDAHRPARSAPRVRAPAATRGALPGSAARPSPCRLSPARLRPTRCKPARASSRSGSSASADGIQLARTGAVGRGELALPARRAPPRRASAGAALRDRCDRTSVAGTRRSARRGRARRPRRSPRAAATPAASGAPSRAKRRRSGSRTRTRAMSGRAPRVFDAGHRRELAEQRRELAVVVDTRRRRFRRTRPVPRSGSLWNAGRRARFPARSGWSGPSAATCDRARARRRRHRARRPRRPIRPGIARCGCAAGKAHVRRATARDAPTRPCRA